ncbi:MAG TPA: 6-pyruvoyl-tetrahydropterin synthase-related protein [Sphingobium sp.]
MPSPRALHPYAILALVATFVMLPSVLFGPGETHSASYNFVWISQFGEAMAQGNLYPRWLPGSFEGLGSPTFYFYPPLVYWIAGGIHALGATTLQAINLAGLLLIFLSGVAMHIWLAARGSRAMLGAVLYMVLPYHLLDFYTRGALAELGAFIWLPLIALGIQRLPKRRGMILLALSYGGLSITHLPVAMLTGLFLIAPLVAHRFWQDRTIFWPAVAGGALALMLAAFYLLPALTLQDRISSALLWGGRYRPSAWTIGTMYFAIVPCIAMAMAVLSFATRSIWTAITLLACIAGLNFIPHLWDLPPLDKAQFPWRLMCIAEFAAITSFASAQPRLWIAGIGAALLMPPYIYAGAMAGVYMTRDVDYRAMARELPDAVEYLPAGFPMSAVREKDRLADLRPYRSLPGGTDIDVTKAGPASFRRFLFPIWRVTRDGREVPVTGPVITVDAQPGRYRLERVMIWQEVAGMAISLAAALMLASLSLRRRIAATTRMTRPRRISLLSKFKGYSPFSAITCWHPEPEHIGGDL